ncbi:MAG TPA: electron transfer flavoprotein subunit beta/FixA family protein [Chloroflexota bacterium]
MDIVVCVKRVPDTGEADISIDRTGKDIRKDDLAFDINEWDNFAMEEAVLLKEEHGGTVTAVTIGTEDDEEVLRHCIALGADNAVRIDDPALEGRDPYGTSVALAAAVRRLPHDLVLMGMMASDDGDGQVGGNVAQLLGIPHATQVLGLEAAGDTLHVRRELEGGLEEKVDVRLPALVTVQTGINEPRYVPIAGIRRAARKEIELLSLADLGLGSEQVGSGGARVEVEEIFLPEASEKGEMLTGSTEEVVDQLVNLFGKRGWLR